MRRSVGALTAVVLLAAGVAGCSDADPAPVPGAAPTADPVPLWASETELHDGDTTVPLAGVPAFDAVERTDGGWLLQTQEEPPRVLRLAADGRTEELARLPHGTGWGDIDAAGERILWLGKHGYQVTDLATGVARPVALPPGLGAGDVYGPGAFAGGDIVTGWLRGSHRLVRSRPDGSAAEDVLGDIAVTELSPDGTRFVGFGDDGFECVVGGVVEADARPWRHCGDTDLGNAFSPDSSRLAVSRQDPGSVAEDLDRVVVLDAVTGDEIATVALPDNAGGFAMTAPDRLLVLAWDPRRKRSTAYDCDLTGACTTIGRERGFAVVGTQS